LGRFVNRDPIGYDAGDENLYRYVSNIPISSVDFLGQAISPALPWIVRVLVAGTTILVPVSTPVVVGTVIVVSVGVGVVVAISKAKTKKKDDCYCFCLREDCRGGNKGPEYIGWTTRAFCKSLISIGRVRVPPYGSEVTGYSFCYCKGD
jgi:uncharacterized protein RhaS with RHS repeats